MKLRLHHFLKCSYANGPGARAVMWVQGCPVRCPGCCNPGTHRFAAGNWVAVDDLAHEILALRQHIQGVTISGGEPLAQADALTELLLIVRTQSDLSVVLFTGYAWDELPTILGQRQHSSTPVLPLLLRCADVLNRRRLPARLIIDHVAALLTNPAFGTKGANQAPTARISPSKPATSSSTSSSTSSPCSSPADAPRWCWKPGTEPPPKRHKAAPKLEGQKS
jgi:hypothetical protein